MMQTQAPIHTRQPAGVFRDLSLVLFAGGLFCVLATTANRVSPLTVSSTLSLCLPVLFAVLSLRRLLTLDWSIPAAVLLLLLTFSHPLMLYAVSSDPRALLPVAALTIAFVAALDIWERPDAQARIILGLFIAPLVLLSGGPMILLLLALVSPLTEPTARKHLRVFWSLLLVALMPAAILLFAVFTFRGQTGETGTAILDALQSTFILRASPDLTQLQTFAVTTLPLLTVIAVLAARRRNCRGTWLTLLLPISVALGSTIFSWDMPSWTAVLLAPLLAFVWICRQDLPPLSRGMFIVALVATGIFAFNFDPLWQGSAWRDMQIERALPDFIRTCVTIDTCPATRLRPGLSIS